MRYYYYLKDANDHQRQNVVLPENYRMRIWKPQGFEYVPSGLEFLRKLFAEWWVMSKMGFFKNNDLGACLIYHGEIVAHFSVVLPPFFKVPFLAKQDLQIGPVWTHDDHRKKGFAFYAINKIIEEYGAVPRKFWYITRTDNIPSIKTCEKAGFIKYAEGDRKAKLLPDFLAKYCIDTIYSQKENVLQ